VADIFISYAQKAPEPTQALAAELAALKYSVWFDQRLLPMEKFGQVINQELDAAKAVITIWSEPALKSEWVYAEAMRANVLKKLINVHTPDVRPAVLPVPFNIAQVSPVSHRAKIYEALTKLGVHPGGKAPVERAARDASEAALAYDHIKDSADIELLEQFLIDFADGKQFYIQLVSKRIAALKAGRGGVVVAKPAEVPLPQAGDAFLRIEPGMHTATIWRVGVDAARRLMVTASDDKTARLWALPESGRGNVKLLRTLRVPIGQGDEGKICAVALSPDGKWIAAGGWSEHGDVYIFEAATGRLAKRFGRLGGVEGCTPPGEVPPLTAIFHLAFSLDGSRLAATLSGGNGMWLWETAGWQPLDKDKDYACRHSYGAAFDTANRLYTVAEDGLIRRYEADGKRQAKEPALGGERPFSIATNADGKLAVSFADTTAVEVYDAHTLKRLYAADTGGISGGNLGRVAWSADGARLYAAGRYQSGGTCPIVIWQDEGRGQRSQATLSQYTVMHLLPYSGGIAGGTQDPAFGLIAADGTKRVWQEGITADMRGKKRDALTLSPDGRRIRFGLGWGNKQSVLFDLGAFRLSNAPEAVARLAAPRITGLTVSDWEDKATPKLDGKPIKLEDKTETSRSLAIAPDAQCFVLGADYRLHAYRADGGKLWKMPIPGKACGVNISGNGKLVAAAYDDGTIRWHRLDNGEELLALFVHAKDRRFIAWTPQGYYAASPSAEDLIGWHVNRGFDTAPDFYPAPTFASTFRRPDIVKAALDIDGGAAPPKAEGLLDKVRKLF
jgi:WD40 repeat protein